MAAMRLYTLKEFEDELRSKWKLERTDVTTATSRLWRTPAGKHVSVAMLPAGEAYPDCIIDGLVERLDALGENPLKPNGGSSTN